MTSFWNVVNEVIEKSDILLEVVDARFIEDTRNQELEQKILRAGKKLLIVINKADLVEKEKLDEYKKRNKNVVFVSAKERLGTGLLREAIFKMSTHKPIFIGVVGYPNTGKSSIVNILKGSHAAPTSRTSGFTTGKRKVKIAQDIYLLDTPGVIPFQEKDEIKHALTAVKNVQQIKEPDIIALKIIELCYKENPSGFEAHYDILMDADSSITLERVAERLAKKKKGGDFDSDAAARVIILHWQEGKIR